mgnify:CR=1 FL=1
MPWALAGRMASKKPSTSFCVWACLAAAGAADALHGSLKRVPPEDCSLPSCCSAKNSRTADSENAGFKPTLPFSKKGGGTLSPASSRPRHPCHACPSSTWWA